MYSELDMSWNDARVVYKQTLLWI